MAAENKPKKQNTINVRAANSGYHVAEGVGSNVDFHGRIVNLKECHPALAEQMAADPHYPWITKVEGEATPGTNTPASDTDSSPAAAAGNDAANASGSENTGAGENVSGNASENAGGSDRSGRGGRGNRT